MRVSRTPLARWILALSLPLAAWSFAPSVYAQPAEPTAQDIAQARQLGGQAQAAFDAGNFAESEKLWNAAAKLYPSAPTLTLGLARTQAKLGKYVDAQESYNKIIREWGNNPSPPPAFKDALEAAKTEVGSVSTKVGTVVVTVEGAPPNAHVTIDGEKVPNAALGLKRPVNPGTHKVEATADGYHAASGSFSVTEGGSAEAKLKMEKNPDAPPVAGGPAPGPGTEPGADTGKGGGSNKTLAYVAFGVGGAGLVMGAITGLLAIGKKGDLSDACPDGKCKADQQDNIDSYKTMGTLSTVGFIIAGVGGAAGVILLLTGPKESASASTSRYATVPTKGVTLTPYFGGTSAGITGRF